MELYNFQRGAFDQFLTEFIGKTRTGKQWELIRRDVELIHQPNANWITVETDSTGFFTHSAATSSKIRVFLYLRNYNVVQYGFPKKHYFECETVKTYGNFAISNEDFVNIYCNDTGKTYHGKSLDICKNCQDIFKEKTSQDLFGKSHDEFILQWASQNRDTPLDLHGYPINFSEVSTAFRKKKDYTCEKCRFKITDPQAKKYMHAHHKNKSKTDNREENLQCLCIECHSNVDKLHRRNFKTDIKLARDKEDFLQVRSGIGFFTPRHPFQQPLS
jgi:hypothetical protein